MLEPLEDNERLLVFRHSVSEASPITSDDKLLRSDSLLSNSESSYLFPTSTPFFLSRRSLLCSAWRFQTLRTGAGCLPHCRLTIFDNFFASGLDTRFSVTRAPWVTRSYS